MSDQLITAIVTILTAIIGVAIIAVLLSKQANTTNVIGAGSQGFSNMLAAALSPVTGGSSVGSLLSGLTNATTSTILYD
jgi:uncharacterized membrane protein YbjE (DUF340 family)